MCTVRDTDIPYHQKKDGGGEERRRYDDIATIVAAAATGVVVVVVVVVVVAAAAFAFAFFFASSVAQAQPPKNFSKTRHKAGKLRATSSDPKLRNPIETRRQSLELIQYYTIQEIRIFFHSKYLCFLM